MSPKKRPGAKPKDPPKAKIAKSKGGFDVSDHFHIKKIESSSGLFQDISIIIDTTILNEDYGANLTSVLAEHELRYQIRNQLIPRLISFERNDDSGSRSDVNVHLLILLGHDVVTWIEDDILIPTVKSYADTYPGEKISLLIFGFRKFLRGSNTKLSRLKIETELTRLQIHTKISHRLIEKPDVLLETIVHFGKAVAEIPAK